MDTTRSRLDHCRSMVATVERCAAEPGDDECTAWHRARAAATAGRLRERIAQLEAELAAERGAVLPGVFSRSSRPKRLP